VDIALHIGSEKGADLVIISEALEEKQRRNQHGSYNLICNTAYLAVYGRKDKHITVKKGEEADGF